jgi:ABC-type transporter Mla maintaining outer membrane lipid asymmetry ATPase subunit MlaF
MTARGVAVRLDGVRRQYGDHEVLAGIDLAVQPGELLAVVGQSGQGKSVLLRQIVGLERPDAGRIVIGGLALERYLALPFDEKPFRIAMVFQSSALLASLTVADNVALRLREHHLGSPAEIAARWRRSTSRMPDGCCRAISRAACASAPPSRARSPPIPSSSSTTSPPPTSIPCSPSRSAR